MFEEEYQSVVSTSIGNFEGEHPLGHLPQHYQVVEYRRSSDMVHLEEHTSSVIQEAPGGRLWHKMSCTQNKQVEDPMVLSPI